MTHLISPLSVPATRKPALAIHWLVAAFTLAGLTAGCAAPVGAPSQRPNWSAAPSFLELVEGEVQSQNALSASVPIQAHEASEPALSVDWPALEANDFTTNPASWDVPGEWGVNWPLGAGAFQPVK